jgi:hypothetical protein
LSQYSHSKRLAQSVQASSISPQCGHCNSFFD